MTYNSVTWKNISPLIEYSPEWKNLDIPKTSPDLSSPPGPQPRSSSGLSEPPRKFFQEMRNGLNGRKGTDWTSPLGGQNRNNVSKVTENGIRNGNNGSKEKEWQSPLGSQNGSYVSQVMENEMTIGHIGSKGTPANSECSHFKEPLQSKGDVYDSNVTMKPDDLVTSGEKSFPPKILSQLMRNGRYGSMGTPVGLKCNHFKVPLHPEGDVFHYHVTIKPDVTKKRLNRKIMDKLCLTYQEEFLSEMSYAYDGSKSLFTVGPLPLIFIGHNFPVMLDDDPSCLPLRKAVSDRDKEARFRKVEDRIFMVTIKDAGIVKMRAITSALSSDQTEQAGDALRVLDIMLRDHVIRRSYLLIRESCFQTTLGYVADIGEGMQVWRGYHASFKPTSCGSLTLNFDLSNTTHVIKPLSVLQFIEDYCKKPRQKLGRQDWLVAMDVLKGVKVEMDSKRKHKILDITQLGCNVIKFEKKVKDSDGQFLPSEDITVADYFQNVRKICLKHPSFPALDLGRPDKPMYVPVELCNILEGQCYKSLNGVQRTKHNIDASRRAPDERRSMCKEAIHINDYNANELATKLGIFTEPEMMAIEGRILDPPDLLFGDCENKPKDGRWNFNSKKMNNPSKIGKWAVVNFNRQYNGQRFADQLMKKCTSKGMEFGEVRFFEETSQMQNCKANKRVDDMITRQILGSMQLKPTFVVAILPQKSSDLYAPFKKLCETQIGIVTQCVVPPRILTDQYLTSVALKINLKSGGYNTVLAAEERKSLPKVSQTPTCIFGLNISHSSPGPPGHASSPSIAAAVCSMNWPSFSTYTTRVRAQPPNSTVITGLYEKGTDGKSGGMVKELLADFLTSCQGQDVTSCMPKQIVIFRQGVNESQFDQVLEKELPAFKEAVWDLSKNSNVDDSPKITLIVAQKRHHTRFFPADARDNVKPGTVVDTDVCHPRNMDFFLCSHSALIGTTRPTHYQVLYDEIGFTVDELQHLTNSLCYSFGRSTTAVSVVAPVYYAHLAARHCRSFITSNGCGSKASNGNFSTSVISLPKVVSQLNKRMFYI